jgi:acetyltransferase-like isoleucine patch superfamily enzyme
MAFRPLRSSLRSSLQLWRIRAAGRAAEHEALAAEPGSDLHHRRRYLRLRGVVFEDPIWIGPSFYLRAPGGLDAPLSGALRLGKRCSLGEHTSIIVQSSITIGDDFLTPGFININSGSHDPDTLEPNSAPIVIGSRVWAATGVIVTSGSEIGDDVVIGAGSVVIGKIPSMCLAVGSPARPIKELRRGADRELWTWAKS